VEESQPPRALVQHLPAGVRKEVGRVQQVAVAVALLRSLQAAG